MKAAIIIVLLVGMSFTSIAQKNLVDSLTAEENISFVTGAFKSSRVINGHSMEMIGKRVLDVRILHRFGELSEGLENLFGLDEASMRMGFDYGLSDNVTLGFGRSTFNKELDGFFKWRILRQSAKTPLAIVLIAGAAINSSPNSLLGSKQSFSDRTAYYYQAILGRKFSDRFSLQLSPTIVHRNLVTDEDANDIFALGAGARLKLSKRIALVGDYFYVFNGIPGRELHNPLSIGIDIETGGHVFQLHFTNAVGMNERAFISETIGSWGDGDIRFGFNLSRVFTLGKRSKQH